MYPVGIPCTDPCGEGWEINTQTNGGLPGGFVPIPTLQHYVPILRDHKQPLLEACPQLPRACKYPFLIQLGAQDRFDPPGPQAVSELSYTGPITKWSMCKAEISWPQTRNEWERILVDIGHRQDIVTPPTTQVRVNLLVPTLEGAGVIPGQFQNSVQGPTDVRAHTTAQAKALLLQGSTPPRNRVATFTQSVFLEPEVSSSALLPIPPGARTVQMFCTDETGSPPPFIRWEFAPPLLVSLGVTVSTTGNISHYDVPQNVRFVRVVLPGGAPAQICTLVFLLEF